MAERWPWRLNNNVFKPAQTPRKTASIIPDAVFIEELAIQKTQCHGLVIESRREDDFYLSMKLAGRLKRISISADEKLVVIKADRDATVFL